MQTEQTYDVVILGGGPGGVRAGLLLAKQGKQVALIEKCDIGGCCVHTGCIPTKTLVEIAKHYTGPSEAFWAQVTSEAAENIQSDYEGLHLILRARGVHLYQGEARILDAHHVCVDQTTISCQSMIIATGAEPVIPTIEGITEHSPRIGTTDTFWKLDKLPKRLIILGGGVIGCEIAGALMHQVETLTIIEKTEQLMPGFEAAQVELVEDEFLNHHVRIKKLCMIDSIREDDQGLIVRIDDGEDLYGDYLLIAAGRKPVYPKGLELILSDTNYKTDHCGRTQVSGIYMIGDVNGQMPFAHYSQAQAAAVVNIILGKAPEMPEMIPVCAFTQPPLANIGMKASECAAEGLPVVCGTAPFYAVGMAKILKCPQGFLKLYRDTERDLIIGASIAGSQSMELLSALMPFVAGAVSPKILSSLVYAHPTVSEAIRIALDETYEGSAELLPKRKKRRK